MTKFRVWGREGALIERALTRQFEKLSSPFNLGQVPSRRWLDNRETFRSLPDETFLLLTSSLMLKIFWIFIINYI